MQQIATQQAQFQQQFSESQRQFNAQIAMSKANASAPSATNQSQALLGDLQSIANNYKSTLGRNPNGLRENIIQQLTSKYGAFVDPSVISNLVYKTYIPDSLENQNQKATKNPTVSAINSATGFRG